MKALMEFQLTCLSESQTVVVRLFPSHLLILAARAGFLIVAAEPFPRLSWGDDLWPPFAE